MNLGLMYALIVVAIVLVIVVAGSFVAMEKVGSNWRLTMKS